jgi:RNA polymerase sigma-70 factor (ECF subfamily)
MGRIAASGDQGAVSELYDRYAGLVYASGLRYLGDSALAEDLVQEVFLAVWRNAKSFDPSRASFGTWIFRIARNRATDMDRRRRSRPKTTGDEALAEAPGGDRADANLAESLDVAAALSRLSSAHREVLVLAYFKGLTQREITLYTGIPLGTVKTRTVAALKALRVLMGPTEGEARDARA